MKLTRRQVVQMLGAFGVAQSPVPTPAAPAQLARDLNGCLALQGRKLEATQAEAVRQSLKRNLEQFQAVRDLEVADGVAPALIFRPPQR